MIRKYLARAGGDGLCKSLRIKHTAICFMFIRLFSLAFLIAFFFLDDREARSFTYNEDQAAS